MARPNPVTQMRRDTGRQIRTALTTPDDMSQNTSGPEGAAIVGSTDPETGEWKPVGRVGVTKLGEPFYVG